MNVTTSPAARSPGRDLSIMADPSRWLVWPFLPLVRRPDGRADFGVLFDTRRVRCLTGYRCTVWRTNVFLLPRRLEQFLALPKEVFDSFDEIIGAGWHVD